MSDACNSSSLFGFQKHEDESESWLHRQVRGENTASPLKETAGVCRVWRSLNGPIARSRQEPCGVVAGHSAYTCFPLSTERAATLFPRRTQVFLHQSDPAGREREVFPHLHVHLFGRRLQKHTDSICLEALVLVVKYLILFKPNSSADILQSLTSGDWDVTRILAYNHERNLM